MISLRSNKLRRAVFTAVPAAMLGSWLYASSRPGIWVDVTTGPLSLRIDVEGTLQAEASRQFGPPMTPGMWEFKLSFMAPEGADVAEGERILAFDDSQLQDRLQQATAELESALREIDKKLTGTTLRQRDHALTLEEARAKLTKAELKLERPAELVARQEVAVLELDRQLARREVDHLETTARLLDEGDAVELAILENQRDQASGRANDLRAAIERMTYRAPRDGSVIYVSDRRGEKKRVGDSVWLRDKVLAVPDLSRMSAEGLVDEADAGRLAIGQPVEFHLDAHPEVPFTGSIVAIGRTVQPRTRNSPLRVVRVEIAIPNTDQTRMRPEMRFRGTIEVERHENMLLAPLSAIHQTSEGPTVIRKSLLAENEVPVTLGPRSQRVVAILSGLDDGDRLRVGADEH